jgi:hypothetical protein
MNRLAHANADVRANRHDAVLMPWSIKSRSDPTA